MELKTLQDVPPWEWPRGIGHKFLTILRDRQAAASDRLLAAEFAGDLVVMNDPLAHALLTIVSSAAEPDELRAKAAISLGPVLEQADIDESEDPDAVPISEETFIKIRQSLKQAYLDSALSKLLRRRILEAAVRSRQEWQTAAIRTAWESGDPEWKLTAVFCMNYVRGFDKEILEALKSADPEVQLEAVRAAGTWEVDAAWLLVARILTTPGVNKNLLLTAIEASATIRPSEAGPLLVDLSHSEDEDIAEAADEAMSMAEGFSDDEFDDEFDDEDDDEDDDSEDGNRKSVH
jgi:hypothetical protein